MLRKQEIKSSYVKKKLFIVGLIASIAIKHVINSTTEYLHLYSAVNE